jgi:hypothetical protein
MFANSGSAAGGIYSSESILGLLKSLKVLSLQDAALKRFPELMSKTTSSDECVNLRHIRCQLCAVTVKDEKNLQARV